MDTQGEYVLSLESSAVSWLDELRSYAAHFILYAILAALIQTALWGWNSGSHLRWAFVAAVFASLFGISDEYHQSFVGGRSATVADALVDSAGSAVSAISLWLFITARPKWRAIG